MPRPSSQPALPPKNVEKTRFVPAALIFVINTLVFPKKLFLKGTASGKLEDPVHPVIYKFPSVSIAISPGVSWTLPPKYVEYKRLVPDMLIFVINTSLFPLLLPNNGETVGKSLE